MAKRDSGPVSEDVLFQSAVSIYCATTRQFGPKPFAAKFKEIYAAVRDASNDIQADASPKKTPVKRKKGGGASQLST